jgi:hypothetical protein
MSQATRLLEFQRELPKLVECLQFYGLFTSELPRLTDWLKKMEKTDAIQLKDVPPLLQEIEKACPGVQPSHLDLFRRLQEAKPVIEFLRSTKKNFGEISKILLGQLQGHRMGLEIMYGLTAVRELAKPFLWSPEKLRGRTLTTLLVHIAKMLGALSPADLAAKFEQITLVHEHLDDVRYWFSQGSGQSLDTLLPMLNTFFTSGRYCSSLTLSPSGAQLVLETGQGGGQHSGMSYRQDYLQVRLAYFGGESVSEEDCNMKQTLSALSSLQDLLRGMTIFVDRDLPPKDLQPLNTFLEIHRTVETIHALRLDLERQGHPQFQVRTSSVRNCL